VLTAEYIRRTEQRFRVLAGRDVMILGPSCMAASLRRATANIVPALVVEIYEKFLAGDLEGPWKPSTGSLPCGWRSTLAASRW